ncbi:PREDICTED: N-acetylneuraminate lyase-like isoform X2 [Galeopterus variegatus]|uniref:N-acetylneuraminate lyase n=1 Tax=Galeopterus variegatus TaxID=482537 RepID=A0ABM0SK53_GALVR|nr:PREDICTED: N-acetylneuraminate lyase-like isoform X1 [Galeopterus variegatus]XP_008593244.1 PREDICTED: N-acetylneuraminate lyase-like isoform X2 [Galeopterus variegatus]
MYEEILPYPGWISAILTWLFFSNLKDLQKTKFCIQRFINSMIKLGFGVSQIKAVMTLVSGIQMGPPRLPLQKASKEFTAKAESKLKSLHILSSTG